MDALQKLGIDGWSVVLYVLNTALLVAILTKLLYKPILRFLDERQETIRRNLTEVEELRRSFELETKKQEAAAQAEAKRMRTDLAAMKAEAETNARVLLEEATARRDALLKETTAQIDAAKRRLMQDAEKDIQARIERVVLHVLRKKVPQEAVQASVTSAWEELGSK